MKAFQVAVMLVLLTGTAFAQNINLMRETAPQTAEEREKEKAIEDAYRAKMNQIPDQKVSSDPWGNVRNADTSKGTQTRKQK